MASSITLSSFELTRFFFAVVCLLASAHFFGYVFHHWRFPRVVGEIFGGFLMGPTGLGFVAPDVAQWLFGAFPTEGKLLSVLYWFGLILLMFVSGFEIQKKVARCDRSLIVAITLGSTVIPFAVGWLAPQLYDFSPYLGVASNPTALNIVIAVAVAVTSIPVISRIFLDLRVMHTRFAQVVLATATLHDVILWVAVAIATGLVTSGTIAAENIIVTVLITLAFFGLSLLLMPRLMQRTNAFRYNLLIKSSVSGYTLFICLLFAAVASWLDVNIVFGAFLAGVVIGLMPDRRFDAVKAHLKEMSMAFFVPLYFAIVGMKLDLIHHLDVPFFVGFFAFSTAIGTFSTVVSARCMKVDWRSSINLGIAMATRGGPGIVLATLAFDLGIINQRFFVALVLIAITTSLMAGWWFRRVLAQGQELLVEQPVSPPMIASIQKAAL